MPQKRQAADGDRLGIYIHIPFCRSKCDYCDFYSLAGQQARMDDYQKALLAHLRRTAPIARSYTVDTVYFGGGTPSFYGEERLRELLSTVREFYRLGEGAEITLEANPDSVDFTSLRSLCRAGFNRLSLGMQSACPEELERVHRPHTVEQADAVVEAARRAGMENLSLDLIYGLPGQTPDSWRATVEHALALGPEHLSCYGLKVEEGTPLAARLAEEALPDDDTQADCYLWTVDRLAQGGYEQYEISNFAKPGLASRHNLRYWHLRPYLGFGPGAHSDFGGRRYSWARDLEGYIRDISEGEVPLDSEELISQAERGREYLMLGLRTTRGVDAQECRETYLMDFAPLDARLKEFEVQGWTEKTSKDRWCFTPKGFLVSNRLIGDLLENYLFYRF